MFRRPIVCSLLPPKNKKSPRKESWAMEDRVSESGKTRHSNRPAHGWANTYRRKPGVGRGETSKRERGETSKSGYAAAGGVSIAGCGARGGIGWLEEIPLVAVKIFEDGDGAVGFFARRFEETDAARLVGLVFAPEVVGVEKEKDAAAGLIANGAGLFGSGGFGKEKSGAAGFWRSDEDPAFVVGERSVLEQLEAEFLGIKLKSLIIVANDDG